MPRQLEALDRGNFCAVDFQDREILIQIIANVEIYSVGCESRAFGQAADFHIVDLCHFLSAMRSTEILPLRL